MICNWWFFNKSINQSINLSINESIIQWINKSNRAAIFLAIPQRNLVIILLSWRRRPSWGWWRRPSGTGRRRRPTRRRIDHVYTAWRGRSGVVSRRRRHMTIATSNIQMMVAWVRFAIWSMLRIQIWSAVGAVRTWGGVRDNHVFNGPLGRSLSSFACTAHSAHSYGASHPRLILTLFFVNKRKE